jgi:hypothetical protein
MTASPLYDDATMIKMMAQENMEEWFHSPLIALETVKTVYKFLQNKGEVATSGNVADFMKWPISVEKEVRKMMKAKIKVEQTNFLTRHSCYFCGGMIEKEDVRVRIYVDKKKFHVCWSCAKSGPLGMKKAMIKQAKYFKRVAKDCEYLAAHLQIDCPSWDKIQSAKKKIEKEIREWFEKDEREFKKRNEQVDADVPF